jgi:hypothetical protein
VRRFHSAPAPLPYGSDVDVPEPTPGCEFGSSLRSLRFGEESIDGLSYTQIYRGKLEETMVYPVYKGNYTSYLYSMSWFINNMTVSCRCSLKSILGKESR